MQQRTYLQWTNMYAKLEISKNRFPSLLQMKFRANFLSFIAIFIICGYLDMIHKREIGRKSPQPFCLICMEQLSIFSKNKYFLYSASKEIMSFKNTGQLL